MKQILCIIIAMGVALSVSGCGVKRGLKSPSQIEHEQQKQAAKDAKEREKQADR